MTDITDTTEIDTTVVDNPPAPTYTPFPFLFSLGHKFKLTEPQEIMDEVLRFYTLAPGTWNVNALEPFSLSNTLSYCNTGDEAIIRVRDDLVNELAKYFPQGIVECEVSVQAYGNGWYTLTITPLLMINNTTYQVSKTAVSQSGTLVLLNDNVDINAYISQMTGEV